MEVVLEHQERRLLLPALASHRCGMLARTRLTLL
jgi:hypothetical protein